MPVRPLRYSPDHRCGDHWQPQVGHPGEAPGLHGSEPAHRRGRPHCSAGDRRPDRDRPVTVDGLGKRRSWARVVSAVFFGINTVDLLISLFMVHAVATLLIGVAIWLAGLGAIALLFGKESGSFYKQQSAAACQ